MKCLVENLPESIVIRTQLQLVCSHVIPMKNSDGGQGAKSSFGRDGGKSVLC